MSAATGPGGARLAPAGALVLVAACVLALARPARAQAPGPQARLDYLRGGLASCPDESFFRDYVAQHLGGDDPFVAQAAERISLKLRRPPDRPRLFAVAVAMYDQADARLGGDELRADDCTALVESAGLLVVSWLQPLTGPVQAPERVEQHAEPAAPPPLPAARTVPAEAKPEARERQAPTVPSVEPKAGVFEGKAGATRAALYGLTAGGLAMGSVFVLGADNKGNGARQVDQTLQEKMGPSACMNPRSDGCQDVARLAQQHDTLRQLAIGSFVAAGVLGSAATASIWLVRTPAAPALHLQPSASRRGGDLTLRGSW
jgi:hypothetical protein